MRMLADRVGRSAIRPWSFHVAHIYHTMTRVVKKAYGDEGESVIHQGIAAFGARYGEEMVARIQTIASAEFGR